ncbi:MAG: PAC2 family protein [Arcanobacterium sp.]|nr:PAC2 family protein [Arcanobacterium sp.]
MGSVLCNYVTLNEDLKISKLVVNLLDHLVDAGSVMQALDYSISTMDKVRIADFSADELFDFRAQRPVVNYRDGKIEQWRMPKLYLDLVTDLEGQRFLYFGGNEPDFRWPSLVQEFLAIIEKFGVEETFTIAAMPGAIPHTRPADMLIRSTEIRDGIKYVPGQAEHFGTLSDYLEVVAGERQLKVTNIRVRVPFYLAQSEAPFFSGVLAAVKFMGEFGGLKLPLGDLVQLADQQQAAFTEFLTQNSELAELVGNLEDAYDRNPDEASFTTADDHKMSVPSFDEIGEAVEKFLATQEQGAEDLKLISAQGANSQVISSKEQEKSKRPSSVPPSENRRRRGKHHY